LEEYFSRTLQQKILQKQFIQNSCDLLAPFGFDIINTIPFVATCRDELACSIFTVIDEHWRSPLNAHGVSFSVSSLGGMILLGKKGMASAISHAPLSMARNDSSSMPFPTLKYSRPELSVRLGV